MLSLALAILQLVAIIHCRVTVAPTGDSSILCSKPEPLSDPADVETRMQDLLQKHKSFIQRHTDHGLFAHVQTAEDLNPSFTSGMKFHMVPVTKEKVRRLKDRLRGKIPDYAGAQGFRSDTHRDMKSMVLFFSTN